MSKFSSGVRKAGSKNWVKILAIAFGVVIVFGLVVWNRFEHWYGVNLKPVASSVAPDVIFTVESGQTADEIAVNLQETGVINSSRVFTIYLDRTGQRSKLQAGTYRLNPGMGTNEVADIIAEGKIDVRLLTIIPGLRLDEIEETLTESGMAPTEVKNAINATYSHPLLDLKPKKASLEGYIFPESFQVTPNTTPEEAVTTAFDQFWSLVDDKLLKDIESQGLSFHEAVTLASIVQLESNDPEEQKKIAQVFLKRLREDIALGADPTFFYAAAVRGVEPSTTIDSPYNTRIYPGLPPGPISNFTIAALEAVARPADTDFLFFVAGDDGITRFSSTLEEHEALAEQYCVELCKLQ